MTDFDELNDTIRYTNWTAFTQLSPVESEKATESFNTWKAEFEAVGGVVRGVYDIRGFRGDSQLLLWIHAEHAEQVQHALAEFSRTEFGQHFRSFWSGMGLHRPAEFNKRHVPGFMTGKPAKDWITVYPFVRSYEWYLLPDEERMKMLKEHGIEGSKYSEIVSNTVASFALGDYEWLLALESDELHELVDMMRDLRYTEARLHVREEVPFFTGKQIDLTNIGKVFS